MSDTTYVDFVQPAVSAEWLNEINDHVWHDTPVAGAVVHSATTIAVTPFDDIVSTDVQAALNEINGKIPPSDPIDASEVSYTSVGIAAVPTTVERKLWEQKSVQDNGADSSGVVDSFSAFTNTSTGAFVPAGTYLLSASVMDKTFYSFGGVTLTGVGSANILDLTEDFNAPFVSVDAVAYPATTSEYKSEPSLVASTSGRMFCFYRIGPAHQGTVGDTGYLVYRVYNKATKTWGAIQTLVSRTGWDSRNQIAGVTPTGRIIVAYYQCEYTAPGVINTATRTTKYKYSDDDGATWSAEFSLSQYCPYPSLDNVPFGKIISFDNGNLLITVYNYHTIFTLKSTDNGASWGTTSGSVPNPNANITTVYTTTTASDDNITEPTIIKIDESRLVAVCRSIPTGLVSDGTVTWSFLGIRRVNSTPYAVDQYINTTALRVYKCTVAGTTSTTEPTHTSGTATDGTVTWQYMGTATNWVTGTSYSANTYAVTYSNYLYQCSIAGTSGATAPFYAKLSGNETQMAYFKSLNGGTTWKSAQYVTWTPVTYLASTSPPKGVCRGDTVDLAWYSRNSEWTLYRVRIQAGAFFENPAWAFSNTSGESRSRVMRSYIAPTVDANAWRVDVGYVDMTYLPWSDKLMFSWYDKPATGVANKTTLYSTVVDA